MANAPHDISRVEGSGMLIAAGWLQMSATTLTFTKISSPAQFTGDITAYRLGTGRYQVNLANFRGNVGIVIPVVSVGSSATAGGGAGGGIGNIPMSAAITAGSFTTSTDTYGFVIGITSGNTFTDADCTFIALGF